MPENLLLMSVFFIMTYRQVAFFAFCDMEKKGGGIHCGQSSCSSTLLPFYR